MEQDKTSRLDIARPDRRAAIKMTGIGIVATLAATSVAGIARADDAAKDDAAKTEAPHTPVAPLQTEFAYEALVTIDPAVEIGPSSHGTKRYIPITGGTFHGPRIKGVVLSGGADWQLERPDGVLEINALYSIKADDGAVIIVQNRGLVVGGGSYFRTIPQFEAPLGPHDWLNKSVFVGSVAAAPKPGAVVVRVFRVL
jgi:hypothetical protein